MLDLFQTALNVGGLFSARKRRKEEQRRLQAEAGEQRRRAQLAEADLFVEADAAYAQQRLLQEREELATKASEEALRQSRLQAEGPDVFVAPAATPGKTRRGFFDEGSIL